MQLKISSAESFRKYTDAATFARIREYETVSDIWKNSLSEYDNLPALSCGETSCSYKELEAMAAGIRAKICETVPEDHTRIAILAENSIAFAAAFLAVVTSAHSALIFPQEADEKAIAQACRKYHIKALLHSDLLAGPAACATDIPKLAIEKIPAGIFDIRDCRGEDECVLLFTSGTTGRNKAAILSHRAVSQGIVNGCYGYPDVFFQKYLLILPLSHVFGLIQNLMTCLYTGSHLCICQNRTDLFRDIAVFRPTMMGCVPAIVELGLELSKQFGRNMFGPEMKLIAVGGAALSPYLIAECEKYGISLCTGYGLTESACSITHTPTGGIRPASVGLPCPHQELKIVDGELWFRGRNMMDGYADEDEESPFEDGWFRTGDLARFDEDGYIYIIGRCKDIIVLSNGENISPAEIEAHFNLLPCVKNSQVFEDVTDSGEHILALEVIPRTIALSDIPEDGQKDYLMARLEEANHALPSDRRMNRMIIRDNDFEQSPAMKIIRRRRS